MYLWGLIFFISNILGSQTWAVTYLRVGIIHYSFKIYCTCKCMLLASDGRSTEVTEFLFIIYSSSVFLMLFKVNAVNCNTSWKISLFLAYEDDSEKVLKGVRCFL